MRVVYAHFVDVAQVWVDLSYDQIVRLLLQIGVVIFVKLADKKLASTPYLPQFSFDRIEIIPDVFCLLFFLLSLQQGAQYKIKSQSDESSESLALYTLVQIGVQSLRVRGYMGVPPYPPSSLKK